jgi:apolipoprotein N-acyltransferase
MPLNFLLAALSALLLTLTFPKFDFAFLAPVALAPLLIAAARERRSKWRFLEGWAAGVIYWAAVCYWIQPVLEVHGAMSGWLSWIAFALFALIKALHLAVFTTLAGLLMRSVWAAAAIPALWVAIEWTHGSLGFAWLALGNAGIGMSVPLRLAPLTGVYGLSFVFAMTAAALALAALRTPRVRLAPVALLPLLYLLPAVPAPERPAERAVLVQPNIPETADWTTKWVESMHDRLDALSFGSGPGGPVQLLVWPEVPAPVYYYEDQFFRERVNSVARRTRSYMILNVVPHTPTGAPLNSALLISPQGVPLGRYDKMNLVPFGEFVPGIFKALVAKVSSESGDFAPGARQTLLPAGPHQIGAFVCYESVFPDFVRRFAANGAGVLVNISNDGWYGHSAARGQHLLIVRMRAAENRRWILRATNDGVTSTIDPAGRVVRNLPPYEAGASVTGYSWISETTFYSRHGDWFVWLCAAAALAAAVQGARKMVR